MASSSNSSNASRLADTMRKSLTALPDVKSLASIFRVPKELRAGNEKYFTPKTVSIGPLHAQIKSLVDVKTRYFKSFLSRLRPGVTLEDVIRVVQGLEECARGCYAEEIEFEDADEFTRIMLIDGCFILQLLWKYEHKNDEDHQGYPIFLKGRAKWAMLYNLQQDLLLLENQIPFFVLCALYKLVPIEQDDHCQVLIDSVLNFFDSIAPNEKLRRVITGVDPKHLLDLVMFSLFPRPSLEPQPLRGENLPENHVDVYEPLLEVEILPDNHVDVYEPLLEVEILPNNHVELLEVEDLPENRLDVNEPSLEVENHREKSVDVRSALELDISGVKLTKCVEKSGYLTDITFRDGVLLIPTVVLLDSTALLFWNLLALEQCSDAKEYGCVVISYISFMDNLICDNKDVEIFTRKGMLKSWVNDEKEFLVLFNRLALSADMDGVNEFSDISQQLERYCESNIHPLRAYIVRNYFEARWDLMNTVMLFIFTVTQTIFAILDYYGRGKKYYG